MMAAAAGTPAAELLLSDGQKARFLQAARSGPDRLDTGKGISVEQRRTDYATTGNVEHWVGGVERFLMNQSFAVKRRHPDTGEYTTYVSKQKRRRMFNCDEKQIRMSTELVAGGPSARVYFDQSLGVAGRGSVTNARHTTGMFATTCAGQVLPPHFTFDSSAAE